MDIGKKIKNLEPWQKYSVVAAALFGMYSFYKNQQKTEYTEVPKISTASQGGIQNAPANSAAGMDNAISALSDQMNKQSNSIREFETKQTDALNNQLNKSQESTNKQLNDLANSFNGYMTNTDKQLQQVNQTQSDFKTKISSGGGTTSIVNNSSVHTIFAGGADYTNASSKYGNNPNIKVVDVSRMSDSEMNRIGFSSSDIVLGGQAANSSTGHGVTVNSGSATRLSGSDRNETGRLLDSYVTGLTQNKSTSSGGGSSSSSSSSSSGSSSSGSSGSDRIINRFSDKTGSYQVWSNSGTKKVV